MEEDLPSDQHDKFSGQLKFIHLATHSQSFQLEIWLDKTYNIEKSLILELSNRIAMYISTLLDKKGVWQVTYLIKH